LTGIIKVSELLPDPEDRANVKRIVDMFNGKLTKVGSWGTGWRKHERGVRWESLQKTTLNQKN
jgi:hypothetical protein